VSWLLFGSAFFLLVLLAGGWFSTGNPTVIAKVIKWLAVLVLCGILFFVILSGRAALITPLLIFILPFVRRRLQNIFSGSFFSVGSAPSSGQESNVETSYLRMSLDHDSATIQGQVLRGEFKGRSLSNLTLSELLQLLDELEENDSESADLLRAFLDRTHSDWEDFVDVKSRGRSKDDVNQHDTLMTEDEALEILELEPGASNQEVREAHRRLMKKVHPDQGGSTYLASKINQAKELLLDL